VCHVEMKMAEVIFRIEWLKFFNFKIQLTKKPLHNHLLQIPVSIKNEAPLNPQFPWIRLIGGSNTLYFLMPDEK
jgi:hypothetical protein